MVSINIRSLHRGLVAFWFPEKSVLSLGAPRIFFLAEKHVRRVGVQSSPAQQGSVGMEGTLKKSCTDLSNSRQKNIRSLSVSLGRSFFPPVRLSMFDINYFHFLQGGRRNDVPKYNGRPWEKWGFCGPPVTCLSTYHHPRIIQATWRCQFFHYLHCSKNNGLVYK